MCLTYNGLFLSGSPCSATSGTKPYQTWESGESWKHGRAYIVFVQVRDDFATARFDRRSVGLNHLAFHVRGREDVDRIAQEVEARGSRLLYTDRYPTEVYYAAYFEDPDGMKVEIVASEGRENGG